MNLPRTLLLVLVTALLVIGDEQQNDDDAHPSYIEEVKSKRAAAFLDQLVMALHRASNRQNRQYHERRPKSNHQWQLDQPGRHQNQEMKQSDGDWQENILQSSTFDRNNDKNVIQLSPMGLERRGQKTGRVFWRCYFNAVTCFRKK